MFKLLIAKQRLSNEILIDNTGFQKEVLCFELLA